MAEDKLGSPGWIKDLRVRLALMQAELAERLGVTFLTVSRWENGQARFNRLAMKALTALAATRNGLTVFTGTAVHEALG